jgi:uncharacterized membrane protein YjgN (DUF898 family)
MPLTSFGAHDFSTAGYLKPLCSCFVRFNFVLLLPLLFLLVIMHYVKIRANAFASFITAQSK